MFGNETGMAMLLKTLIPQEIWEKISKAATDIPQMVQSVNDTVEVINQRLIDIQNTQDTMILHLAEIKRALDPNTVPVTALTLMDERVQNGHATPEDIEIMTNIPANPLVTPMGNDYTSPPIT